MDVYVLRSNLKAQLLRERGSRCILTGLKATDLHEAIITRAIYGRKQGQERIFHPYNCVLLNHTRHVEKGLDATDRLKIVAYLISLYGTRRIEDWIATLSLRTWDGFEEMIADLERRSGITLTEAMEAIQ